MLALRGVRAAVLSIDDLYLKREEREALAASVHPLLITRGPPGTHDVPLGLDVLDRLFKPGEVPLPRFDKALDTRKPFDQWDVVQGPVDVILFEGWCVGARPEEPAALREPINALERDEDPDGVWRTYVNDALAGPYQDLFSRIDLLVMLKAPSFEVVLNWRIEQEHKLKARLAASGGDLARTMSDAEIGRFIAHYERVTRCILAEMPARADVLAELDETRQVQTVRI
jgi:D-glycerate 3-kinase